MRKSDFWADLAKQFRELPDEQGKLWAKWERVHDGNYPHLWTLGGIHRFVSAQFEALARRAASAIVTDTRQDLLTSWLELLLRNTGKLKGQRVLAEQNTQGHLYGVCFVSAYYCNLLEAEALDQEFAERIKDAPANQPPSTHHSTQTPQQLWASYQAQFPETIVILNVCWAAQQRYREWKRWMNGELKATGKAARAFMAVLTSSKRPEEYRTVPRPPKWQ